MASRICLGSSWDYGMGRTVVLSDTPDSGICLGYSRYPGTLGWEGQWYLMWDGSIE